MPKLTPELAPDVLAACTANAAEAAAAFSRALGTELTLAAEPPGTLTIDDLPEALNGPGLVAVLSVGTEAALVLLPESSGLVPDWCESPDPTGQSKLTTLAQELGMTLLGESLMPDDFKAGRVKNLAGALRRGGVADGAAVVGLNLRTADGKTAAASLVWPAAQPAAVIGTGGSKPKEESKPKAESKGRPSAAPPSTPAADKAKPKSAKPRLRELPAYTRSLLRIKVPVVVTLAEKRQSLGRIVELGPGSIIQFDKSCEEMLDLDIGSHRIAAGEAVKVGDKFGLRITSIVLPEERFQSLRPASPRAAR